MSLRQQAAQTYQDEGAVQLTKEGSRYVFEKTCETTRSVFEPIDHTAGAKLYSNCSGLSRNLVGDIAEMKAKMRADVNQFEWDQSHERARHAAELREKGYTKLGQIYPEEEFSSLKQRYEEIIDQATHTEIQQTNEVDDDRVFSEGISDENLRNVFPEAQQLVNDEVKERLRQYYQAYIQVRKISAYRTHHIPKHIRETTEVYNENWHYDGASTDHIKLFVTLSDTTEEDGPLHIFPNLGMRRVSAQQPNFDRDAHGDPDGLVKEHGEPVTLTGPPGTAMLANTQSCLHRAGVPEEGHTRDLIQFYIAPATEPLGSEWIHDQQLTGAEHYLLARLLKY